MTIFYELDNALYVNITNQCPCSCVFCIRNSTDVIRDSESLWFLSHEPTFEEIKEDFKRFDISKYKEIVFCGYGEPTERLKTLIKTASFLKEETNLPIRLNTNGLGELINKGEKITPLLKGLFDTVSISLNAPNSKRFVQVTNSAFGEKSFDALLSFAKDAKEVFPEVVFTVVDVISEDEIEACQSLADEMGIKLRVRNYVEHY